MKENTSSRLWILGLALVVVGGLALRSVAFQKGDFFGYHGWRLGDSASFTTGYLVDSLNPLEPRVSMVPCAHTDRPFGEVESELPVVAWVSALPLAALGVEFPPAWYLRAVSLLFYLGTCMYLLLFVRQLGGRMATGLLTVAAFSTLPLAAYFTVSPQPDGPSLFFAVALLFHLDRWMERWRPRDGILSACLGALMLLLKVSNGVHLFVALYLAVSRLGVRGVTRRWTMWLWALVVLLPAAGWYAYAHASFEYSFGIYDDKIANLEQMLDLGAWKTWVARLPWHSLTWGGLILAIVGLAAHRDRRVGVVMAWFGALLLYTALTLPPQIRHSYYQLPIALPASIAMGMGVTALWERGWGARGVLAILLVVHALTVDHVLFGGHRHAKVETGFFTLDLSKLRRAAQLVQEHVPERELVVTTITHRSFLHNARRRGWVAQRRLPAVVRCMEEGAARYAVVPAGWRIPSNHRGQALRVLGRRAGFQLFERSPAAE